MRSFHYVFRCAVLVVLTPLLVDARAQAQATASSKDGEVEELRQTVRDLSLRVAALEEQLHKQGTVAVASPNVNVAGEPAAAPSNAMVAKADAGPLVAAVTSSASVAPTAPVASAPHGVGDVLPAQLPGGATLNYFFDGYYGYDFNHPIGRVQYLRAYDVLSNAFSLSQAGVVLALDPSLEEGRRYGVRLDLQFGQATETLQGNPANEPRPEIYRNIFQAYGTYVFPVGRALTVDFGK